jgi:hypothetical protein
VQNNFVLNIRIKLSIGIHQRNFLSNIRIILHVTIFAQSNVNVIGEMDCSAVCLLFAQSNVNVIW